MRTSCVPHPFFFSYLSSTNNVFFLFPLSSLPDGRRGGLRHAAIRFLITATAALYSISVPPLPLFLSTFPPSSNRAVANLMWFFFFSFFVWPTVCEGGQRFVPKRPGDRVFFLSKLIRQEHRALSSPHPRRGALRVGFFRSVKGQGFLFSPGDRPIAPPFSLFLPPTSSGYRVLRPTSIVHQGFFFYPSSTPSNANSPVTQAPTTECDLRRLLFLWVSAVWTHCTRHSNLFFFPCSSSGRECELDPNLSPPMHNVCHWSLSPNQADRDQAPPSLRPVCEHSESR